MLALRNPRFPAISCRHMFVQRPCLAFLGIEILTIGSVWNGIIGPKESSRAKFGEEELGDVLERGWEERVGLVGRELSSRTSWNKYEGVTNV